LHTELLGQVAEQLELVEVVQQVLKYWQMIMVRLVVHNICTNYHISSYLVHQTIRHSVADPVEADSLPIVGARHRQVEKDKLKD